jgi:flagellin
MTRINTNVSSLVAQTALARSHTQLQQALTRLSTGLRINTGADDPAGLIASQVLQSNINSTNQAITNSQQANELIATADSALGQVSTLLNSIRGLVSDAANTGALSSDQIAANQLQVDSSLAAIDRISQSTSFQGRRLLDGSLDFLTTSAGTANLHAIGTIGTQADAFASGNFGGTSNAAATTTVTGDGGDAVTFTAVNNGAASNGYQIEFQNASGVAASAAFDSTAKTLIITAASGATAASVVAAVAANASAAAVFAATTASAGGSIFATTATVSGTTAGGSLNNQIVLSASTAGTAFNNANVTVANDAATGAETAAYSTALNTLTVHSNANSTVAQVVAAINTNGVFSASTITNGASLVDAGTTSAVTASGALSNVINLQAVQGGTSYNNASVVINQNAATGAETASYNAGTNTLTIHSNANSVTSQLISAINTEGTFSASTAGGGLGVYAAGTLSNVTTGGATGSSAISDLQINQADFGTATQLGIQVNIDQQATQAQLIYSGGPLASNTVLQIGGDKGFQVFNFGAGTTLAQLQTAVNLVSDSTGVTATIAGSQLKLQSSDYGSSANVSAKALVGSFSTHLANHTAAARTTGTDIAARINGVQATGNGLVASLNASTLNLSFSVNANFASGDSFNFAITGGGANFQLGPDVVSQEQARLGIPSVSTTTLGGVAGTLYELRSGGAKSLSTDTTGAAAVVSEAITKVASLRGQLGAFQATTLQTNINTLTDTVSNLTNAQSQIQDADFAAETASLTRAQILVQSGTSVLQISNQSPQQVLALLRTG